MTAFGWNELDILLVSGDAYVDHPSFGVALLGRVLQAAGFRVGVISQPRWEQAEEALADISRLGRPRLFAGVTAGAIDSMLAHYTAFRKKRGDDAYTPGGKAGARPNRACIVYTGLLRRAFPGLPVVLGGIEASLRRISHYDFWSDSLRRSLLLDSKADALIYGMGEYSLLAVARAARTAADQRLFPDQPPTKHPDGQKADPTSASPDRHGCAKAPPPPPDRHSPDRHSNAGRMAAAANGIAALSRAEFAALCREIPGLALAEARAPLDNWLQARGAKPVRLPAHEDMARDPSLLMTATLEMERQIHRGGAPESDPSGLYLVQDCGDRTVLLTPPAPLPDEAAMDAIYALPFTRLPHPSYAAPIPAWEMIRTSITTHRGCGGGCSFCSLALHQGRRIASRSRASVLREAESIAAGPPDLRETGPAANKPPRWAGAISDVGGPSANMWQAACALPEGKTCARASCLTPGICPFFALDQQLGVRLLRDIAALPGVRHVRVASGVRFDLALRDADALYAYTAEFTGGQLKVAPEHTEDAVLRLMRKPSLPVFERFLETFARHCGQAGKEQYTVPYLISAFPGCTEAHMRALAAWLKRRHWSPRQVQCFIPTPGTVATAMFYADITPEGEALYVARTDRERLRQHHLLLGEDERDGNAQAAKPAQKTPGKQTGGQAAKRTEKREGRQPHGRADKRAHRHTGE